MFDWEFNMVQALSAIKAGEALLGVASRANMIFPVGPRQRNSTAARTLQDTGDNMMLKLGVWLRTGGFTIRDMREIQRDLGHWRDDIIEFREARFTEIGTPYTSLMYYTLLLADTHANIAITAMMEAISKR